MDRTRTVTGIAKKLVAPFPNAKAHLRHYLQGTGETLEVNLAGIWAQDEGIRNHFSYTVRPVIQRGTLSGSLIIPQTRLTVWDWRLALGSMTYTWSIDGQNLLVKSFTTYKWSPDEQRITRPLHRALDDMTRQGAAPFTLVGKPFHLSLDQLPGVRSLSRLPFHRRMYL